LGHASACKLSLKTPLFIKPAEKLFSVSEKKAVIDFLATHPYAGDLIPHTGGVRKVRVPASGRGKCGGARVIYYVFNDDVPIYALWSMQKTRASI